MVVTGIEIIQLNQKHKGSDTTIHIKPKEKQHIKKLVGSGAFQTTFDDDRQALIFSYCRELGIIHDWSPFLDDSIPLDFPSRKEFSTRPSKQGLDRAKDIFQRTLKPTLQH